MQYVYAKESGPGLFQYGLHGEKYFANHHKYVIRPISIDVRPGGEKTKNTPVFNSIPAFIGILTMAFIGILTMAFIKVKITGSGASSGDSINLELTRLTSEKMEITVPKGMVLIASDKSQNMVVYKVTGIPEDSKWIIPISEIILDSSDPEVQSILIALDNLSSDITTVEAIQTAIWISTDDVSREKLLDKFPVDQKEIGNVKIILEEAGVDTTSKLFFR